jgi:hypothetical protein
MLRKVAGAAYADKPCPQQPDGRVLSSNIGDLSPAFDVSTSRPAEESRSMWTI